MKPDVVKSAHSVSIPTSMPHINPTCVQPGFAAMSSSTIAPAAKTRPEKRAADIDDPKKVKHSKLDPHSMTYDQVVVFKEIYSTLATANIASLALQSIEIQKKSELVKDVHPLGFLHLIHIDETIKGHLHILRGSWVITQPWTRTHEDFAEKMHGHKKTDTLHLKKFLERLDESLHQPVQDRIEKNQFRELLEMFLSN